MIAKKEWFGHSTHGCKPSGWEGWVYMAIAVLLFIGGLNLPATAATKLTIAGIVLILFIIDMLSLEHHHYDVMSAKTKREQWFAAKASIYIGLSGLILVLIGRAYAGVLDVELLIILALFIITHYVAGLFRK